MGILKNPQDMPKEFELRPSQIPGYGMGVWTRVPVTMGTKLEFNYILVSPKPRSLYCWEICNQDEVIACIDTSTTWLSSVQFARNREEATVEVDLDDLKVLSFQVMKDLKEYDELLITFSDKYRSLIGLPKQKHEKGIIHCCDCCPKMYYHPYSLDLHKLYHCGGQGFMWCDECGQVFALSESLRQHILEHIAEKEKLKQSSLRPFDTENLLRSPVKKPSPISYNPQISPPAFAPFQPFKESFKAPHIPCHVTYPWTLACEHCSKPFSQHGALRTHQRTHSGNKPYSCDACCKTFSRRDSLQAHVRTHTKPFTCGKCGRSFARPDSLVAHSRNHAGSSDRPFKCVECGKGFGVAQALQTHMRIHTGEKPFQCKHCPKAFAHMSSLKVHINSTHTGLKPFKCQHCNMRFADGSNLRRHIQTHTNEKPHSCKQCGKAFARGSILKEHMRTHAKYEKNVIKEQQSVVQNSSNINNEYPAVEAMLKVLQHYRGLHRSPGSAFSPLYSTPLGITSEETQPSPAFNKPLFAAEVQ